MIFSWKYRSKVKAFWNAETVGFRMVWFKNNLVNVKKKMVHLGALLKKSSAVGFSGKAAFWDSVSFHSQMLGATNFGLILDDCIVIAIIFIRKKILKKFSR